MEEDKGEPEGHIRMENERKCPEKNPGDRNKGRKPDSSIQRLTKNPEEKTKDPTETSDSAQRSTPSLRELRSERGRAKEKNLQGSRPNRTERQEGVVAMKKNTEARKRTARTDKSRRRAGTQNHTRRELRTETKAINRGKTPRKETEETEAASEENADENAYPTRKESGNQNERETQNESQITPKDEM